MLNILLLSLSRHYTVDGQYIPSLFIEPEVRHDKTSYMANTNNIVVAATDSEYFAIIFSKRDRFVVAAIFKTESSSNMATSDIQPSQ